MPIIARDTTCPACNQPLDHFGDHLLCCKHNNYSLRHNAVQNVLLDSLQTAKVAHQREVPLTTHNRGLSANTQIRPADILLPCWQHSRHLAVDVTISHIAQRNEQPYSLDKARSFLRRKEHDKHTKYDDPCAKEGWDFTALTMDTWGNPGPKAVPLLHRLIQRCSNHIPPRSRGITQTEMRQRICIALMRQVWNQLAPGSTGWM